MIMRMYGGHTTTYSLLIWVHTYSDVSELSRKAEAVMEKFQRRVFQGGLLVTAVGGSHMITRGYNWAAVATVRMPL